MIILAHRQDTTGSLDTAFVNNSSAIVKRTVLIKDGEDQSLVYFGIECITGLCVKLQFSISGEDNKGSGFCCF